MAKRDKASALKALAKRPALVSAIEKGNKKIKQLRETVEKTGVTSSGGFIRSLVWAAICILDDNKFVKFAKSFKKSEIGNYEKPEKLKGSKPSKKKVVEEDDDEDDEPVKTKKEIKLEKKQTRLDEVRRNLAQKQAQEDYAKKHKQPVKGKVEKSGLVKLIRPIGDIPANHPVLAEYYDGFWHIKGKHIALSNMQFVETKLKEAVKKPAAKKLAVKKPVKKVAKKVVKKGKK